MKPAELSPAMAALDWGPVLHIIQLIGSVILDIAPALIIISYLVCALVWVAAGSNERMVKFAREQFVATTVVLVIIAGYFIVKDIIIGWAFGGGGGFG